ncbi:hypothetical protein RZ54_14080 (plasmid) [Apilactobacillus kunkeei]|uniref:hypothetical protein n=1 Tax=Apilactobacillus kunkeei TaxID=148814 RepID=UPI0006C38762|nr:hypothetical protein [Apilactobacillus kunkeei]KOY71472.1 hypothetical protein RZ54_14080 [Apilactobacillus kunkeei]
MDNFKILGIISSFPYKHEKIVAVLGSKKDYFDNTRYTIFSTGKHIKVLEISDRITSKRNISFREFMETCKVGEKSIREFNDEYGIRLTDDMTFDEIRFGVRLLEEFYSADYSKSIVGKKLFIRSLVSDYYTVKAAEVLEHGKILKVTYDNGDHDFFVNELPVFKVDMYTPDFANKLSKATTPDTAYMIVFNYRYHLKNRQGLIDDYLEKVPKNKQQLAVINRLKTESFEKLCLERLKDNPRIANYKIFKMDDQDFVFYKISAVRYY